MNFRRIALISTTMFLSLVSLSGSAFAFCGVLQASASGYSRDEALSKANNKGLVEVRRLEGELWERHCSLSARQVFLPGRRQGDAASSPRSSASTAASDSGRVAARKAIRCMAARPERGPFRKRIIACLYVNERANLKASRGKSRVAGPGNRAATGATPGPAEDMSRPARSIDARTLRDACTAGVSDRRLAD